MAGLYGPAPQVAAGREDDQDELVKLTARLRDEPLDLEVSEVAPVTEATAPEEAKGLAVLTGWLLLHFGSVSALRDFRGNSGLVGANKARGRSHAGRRGFEGFWNLVCIAEENH